MSLAHRKRHGGLWRGAGEVPGLLDAAMAEIARLEAFKVRCAALLDRRRKTEPSLIAELVDKLKISEKDAKALVTSSRALTDRLPCTLRLMRRGLLTFSLASKVVRATARLSDDQARKADEELEPRLPKKDPTQVRNAAYYAAGKADPDRERRSTQRRVASRCVKLARQGATARLTLENVPFERAAEAYERITHAAQAFQTSGEPRTMDQICADLAVDMLRGGEGVAGATRNDVARAFFRRPQPQRSRRSRRTRGHVGHGSMANRRRSRNRRAQARR